MTAAERERVEGLVQAAMSAVPISDDESARLAAAIALLGAATINACRRGANPLDTIDCVIEGLLGARNIIAKREGAPRRGAW